MSICISMPYTVIRGKFRSLSTYIRKERFHFAYVAQFVHIKWLVVFSYNHSNSEGLVINVPNFTQD